MASIHNYDNEFGNQRFIEQRFFRTRRERPWKHGEDLTRVKATMQLSRTEVTTGDASIDLTGLSARVVVIAEAQINQDCFAGLRVNFWGFVIHSTFQQVHSTPYKKSLIWWTTLEKVLFFSEEERQPPAVVTYVQKALPNENHKGDCRVDFAHDGTTHFIGSHETGCYTNIYGQLSQLTREQPLAEAALATLLLRSVKKLHAITPRTLKRALNLARVTSEQVQFINDLRYLGLVKEIARRQGPKDVDTHDVPWASAMIRALKLVVWSRLRLRDLFGQDAPYGPCTGSDIGTNMDSVIEKIKKINQKYHECFSQAKEGRLAMMKELAEIYGAASDTDEEGYESSGV